MIVLFATVKESPVCERLNKSIWPLNKAPTRTTTPRQKKTTYNEGLLRISLSSRTQASPSDLISGITLAVEVSILYLRPMRYDLSHSTRITFPGSIKRLPKTLSQPLPHIFFKQDRPTLFLIHSSSRTDENSTRGERFQTMGHCSLERLFLSHLFIPPRPNGSRNFRLNT